MQQAAFGTWCTLKYRIQRTLGSALALQAYMLLLYAEQQPSQASRAQSAARPASTHTHTAVHRDGDTNSPERAQQPRSGRQMRYGRAIKGLALGTGWALVRKPWPSDLQRAVFRQSEQESGVALTGWAAEEMRERLWLDLDEKTGNCRFEDYGIALLAFPMAGTAGHARDTFYVGTFNAWLELAQDRRGKITVSAVQRLRDSGACSVTSLIDDACLGLARILAVGCTSTMMLLTQCAMQTTSVGVRQNAEANDSARRPTSD